VNGAAPVLVLGSLLVLAGLLGPTLAARARGPVAAFIVSPFDPAAWRATGSILFGAIVETVAVSIVGSLFSSGVSLLVVGVGIVIVGLGIEVARVFARIERRRLGRVDPRPLHPHPYRDPGRDLRDRFFATFLDMNRWRDVVYVFVAFPLAVLEAGVAITLWLGAIALLSVPLTPALLRVPESFLTARGIPAEPVITLAFAAGVILLPTAASVSRGLIRLHRAVVAGLLCVSEQAALERRVADVEASRAKVLDVEATELRRIERDLHDGAQQRLVRLAMDLGLAAERIDSDPAAARGLVLEAQGQARAALADIRDLVRGIAPAILMDRGLVPAIAALAGRAPVPTTVTASLPEGAAGRLPDAVERAAYFVVAEALANVAKHGEAGGATRCEVRVRREAPRTLVVEVEDDGHGGARVVPGGGLAGLTGRVEALDGSLAVVSPDGGPTIVRASIPLPG
jgi:signal transduction histidine kinase